MSDSTMVNDIFSKLTDKPSWLHPLKRLRYNGIIRDLSAVSKLITKNNDKLAYIISYDIKNIIVSMTYCYNGTGDMAQHRAEYIFNGYNYLNKPKNYKAFRHMLFSGIQGYHENLEL